jgi:hypothetical protein
VAGEGIDGLPDVSLREVSLVFLPALVRSLAHVPYTSCIGCLSQRLQGQPPGVSGH